MSITESAQQSTGKPGVELRERILRFALPAICIVIGVGVGLFSTLINPLILLAAVPVFAVGLWSLRSDERALWLLIAIIGLLPRFAAPVKFVLTPTFLDLAIVVVLVAWAVRISKRPVPFREMPIALPVLGLISVAIVTFVIGLPNGALTPLIMRRFAELLLSLLMVFVLVALIKDFERLKRATCIFFVVGAIGALIGLVLYALPDDLAIRLLSALRPFGYPTGPDVLRYIRDDPALMQRATGLWIDPNAYGGYLLICGAFLLPQLFTSKPVLPRLAVFAALGLVGLALVFTISRGAMLGLLIVGTLLGILRYRRLLVLIAVTVVLILVLPQTRELVKHFAEGFAVQDLASQMRLGEYKDAFRLIARYPLLGVGFADTPDVDLYIGVSNMYLLIAQQMGLIGLVAFSTIVAALFGGAMRARQAIWADEQRSAIWLGAYAAILGALISGIFDHYFFNIDFHNSVMLLWLVIAFAIASQLTKTNEIAARI